MASVKRYLSERREWDLAGRPVREQAEIDYLFRTKCSGLEEGVEPCPDFKWVSKVVGIGRCMKCGCALNLGNKLNKLRWATTNCPRRRPRWRANLVVDEDGTVSANPKYKGAWPMVPDEIKEELKGRQLRRHQRRLAARKAEQDAKEEAKKTGVVKEKKDKNGQTRSDRQSARKKRQEKRAEQRRKMGRHQELIKVPVNEDPLQMFDRNSMALMSHPLRNLWWPAPGAFLVCGGPSVNSLDVSLLDDPRVMSLGVNNVAGWVKGVKAMTFSDPVEKFSGHVFLNPGIIKLVPAPKLKHQIRLKHPETREFVWGPLQLKHCPNTFGFARQSVFDPETFLTADAAQWGGEWNGHRKILYSAFLGLRLLVYLGIKNIFLLGVDHTMSVESGYAFPQGRKAGAAKQNNEHYKIINREMAALRPVLERAGIKVFNCNKMSGCPVWDHIPYERAVEICTSQVPEWPLDLEGWYEKGGDGGRENDNQS